MNREVRPTQIPCGSGLARESGGTDDINVECNAAFASKPAPTGGSPVNSESEYTSLLPIGLIAFTAGCFSVDVTFQNNKNRLSNEPES
jgi:hypothetical protein